MSTAPNSDPMSMPLAELKTAAFPTSDPPAPPADPTPAPAPAPIVPSPADPYSVQQDANGVTVQMSPEFGGEVFKGKDWAEVGPKIAKAKADANAYIKQLKATPAPIPTPPAPPTPAAPTQEEIEQQRVREWLIEQTAAGLNMTPAEYKARMAQTFETTEKMAVNTQLAEFHRICPDFQDTPENTAALTSYFGEGLDHFPTAQELRAAYALALLDGKIQRQAPPTPAPRGPAPMPGTTSSSIGDQNAWQMPMHELKNAINRQS